MRVRSPGRRHRRIGLRQQLIGPDYVAACRPTASRQQKFLLCPFVTGLVGVDDVTGGTPVVCADAKPLHLAGVCSVPARAAPARRTGRLVMTFKSRPLLLIVACVFVLLAPAASSEAQESCWQPVYAPKTCTTGGEPSCSNTIPSYDCFCCWYNSQVTCRCPRYADCCDTQVVVSDTIACMPGTCAGCEPNREQLAQTTEKQPPVGQAATPFAEPGGGTLPCTCDIGREAAVQTAERHAAVGQTGAAPAQPKSTANAEPSGGVR